MSKMGNLKRPVGAALLAYAVLYSLQVIFTPLYAEALDPSEVWSVMNYCTAVGILIALAVVGSRVRGGQEDASSRRIGKYAAVFALVALGIWFFSRWFKLLMLTDDESVSEADNVVWALVSVLVPIVLGTAGLHLWRTGNAR